MATDATVKGWRRLFYAEGPEVTEHGREPSLHEMIRHYYHSHGCVDSERLAKEYTTAWIEECQHE